MGSDPAEQLVLLVVSSCCKPLGICRDEDAALTLKIVALTFVQVAWAMGMWVGCVQVMTHIGREIRLSGLLNLVTRSFASGFALAVGLLYLQSFQVPRCSPEALWSRFPFIGVLATTLGLLLFVIDIWGSRRTQAESSCLLPDLEDSKSFEETDIGDEVQLDSLVYFDSTCAIKQELPAAAYSTMIAIFLGASQNPCTMGPMMAALTFRQFFQGLAALARAVSSPKQTTTSSRFRLQKLIGQFACSFFATPLGVALGIAISFSVGTDDQTAMMVEALLQWVAAFFLAFESCESLLQSHNCLRKRIHWNSKPTIRALYYGAVTLGAGIMPLIASKGRETVCNLRGHIDLQGILYLSL